MIIKAKNPDQLLIPLPQNETMRADAFIAMPSNQEALTAIEKWESWPCDVPGIILVAPPSSGKTHLLHLWREETDGLIITPSYFSIEKMHQIITHKKPLAFDRIDEILETDENQTFFFHFFNLLRDYKLKFILTARTPPTEWGIKLRDLISRLNILPIIDILPPEAELVQTILVKLFYDRQLRVAANTIPWLTRAIQKHQLNAREVVHLIDQSSLQKKCKISLAFVKEIIAKLIL